MMEPGAVPHPASAPEQRFNLHVSLQSVGAGQTEVLLGPNAAHHPDLIERQHVISDRLFIGFVFTGLCRSWHQHHPTDSIEFPGSSFRAVWELQIES